MKTTNSSLTHTAELSAGTERLHSRMRSERKRSVFLLFLVLFPLFASAQDSMEEACGRIGSYLDGVARREASFGAIRIDSVGLDGNTLTLYANKNCSYIPFREENVAEIYREAAALLPVNMKGKKVRIVTDGQPIERLIPLAMRGKKGKKGVRTFTPNRQGKALVTDLSDPVRPTNGLQGRHIALWQSHGFYYEPKLDRWEWQRARIFQTVEDLYTQSYVLPFLVPMLENAGANVLLPRERDCNPLEVIVDNDGSQSRSSAYRETDGAQAWETGKGEGFAQRRTQYTGFENPFREGTYRQVKSIRKGEESRAEWVPDLPADGEYAVYVSYKSVPGSTDDARYTVHHRGGTTTFRVNQQMGGGTWIYLGTFAFGAGRDEAAGKVTLSNRSDKAGQVVTADGVKIGGGTGNIARNRAQATAEGENGQEEQLAEEAVTSGYPRFCEAARYWLQWAGVPDSVYSESHGKNDYTDDYKSRGLWVNYLAGGSEVCPDIEGLNIPVDLAFAFHSDAGTTLNDSIIGTLGIYMTRSGDTETYANGASRYLARDLTDLIQSNIVHDVRTLYEPAWTRRGMWNSSYFEARVPRVPTMLLELLSHQNFADMRYGLDPRFRFTVSRAVYKGMLQFVCSQRQMEYVVQPLPVDHLSVRFLSDTPSASDCEVELTWHPVDDPLEPTACAEEYIVYTRIGEGGFDNGTVVKTNSFRTRLVPGKVCSWKVVAVNRGGKSFPSEILSAGVPAETGGGTSGRRPVLVINGFDRIGAPADFVAPAPGDTLLAGFLDELDHGVPYLKDISYIGRMKEFRRQVPWMDDDASGFGDSYGDYETQVIAGNSFDYPALHGAALLKCGEAFASCSDESVESGEVALAGYPAIDLILGKERQSKMGRGGIRSLEFKTFSKQMQQALADYTGQGGNVFVSGAYIGSDLWDNPLAPAEKEDIRFATEVLKYRWRVGQAARRGEVKGVHAPFGYQGRCRYFHELNSQSYVVESPDAIEPADKEACTILRYSENNLSAGIAYRGSYRTCVLGFPFESIRTVAEREELMQAILTFFRE